MIQELHMRVKPQNKHANIAFWLFFVLAFVVFGVSYAVALYRGVLQLGAMFCLVTSILFYTKYIAPQFCYEITIDSQDTPVFIVTQTIGRRMTTLCRIDLADIQSAEHLSRTALKEHRVPADTRRYVYTPSLLPATVCVVTTGGHGERAQLVLEGGQDFADLLLSQAAIARDRMPPNEE